MITKVCTVCGESFLGRNRRVLRCSDKCRKIHSSRYGKDWVANNKDRHAANVRSWKDRYPERMREIQDDHRRKNLEKFATKERVRRARKRGEGPFNKHHWKAVLDFFQHSCAYCGSPEQLQADHVIPVSRLELGPVLAVENIVPACPQCNVRKSNSLLSEWRPELVAPLVQAVKLWNPGLANNLQTTSETRPNERMAETESKDPGGCCGGTGLRYPCCGKRIVSSVPTECSCQHPLRGCPCRRGVSHKGVA